MQEYNNHPLRKEVPGHLLQFEEKTFGMTLMQLLSDLGVAVSILALTASVPLVPRIVAGVLLMIGVLILVHGTVGDSPLLSWLFLIGDSDSCPPRQSFGHRARRSRKASQAQSRRTGSGFIPWTTEQQGFSPHGRIMTTLTQPTGSCSR